MMQRAKMSFRKLQIIILTLDFIIFGLMGYFMPLVGDDLNWWSSWGVNYFFNGTFLTYDGRYLGDLLIILLSHLPLLSFLVYGLCASTIVYLTQKIVQVVDKQANPQLVMLMASFALMALPKSIFKQIWGWHAGFANYVPSLIFPLFFLFLVVSNWNHKKVTYKIPAWVLFICALLGQFLAEHITILNCFNVFLVFLFGRKYLSQDFVKRYLYPIAIGNFVGAGLMFINGAYLRILLGNDSYRSISDSQQQTLLMYLKNLYTLHPARFIALLAAAGFLALFLYLNLRYWKNKDLQFVTIFLVTSAIVSQLPFLVISPYGPRCGYACLLFLSLTGVINLAPWLTKIHSILNPLLLLVLVVIGGGLAIISRDYHHTFVVSQEFALYQGKQKTPQTYVLDYQNTDLIWGNNNSEDNIFRAYFVEKDSQVVTVPYATWNRLSRNLDLLQPKDQQKLLHKLQQEDLGH